MRISAKHKKIALGALVIVSLSLAGWAETRNKPNPLYSSAPAKPDQTPYGTIQSISGAVIVLSMQAPFMDKPVSYTVVLAASSTIVRHINTPPAEFESQMQAFKDGQASTSPIGYRVVSAHPSDLKRGMVIEAPAAALQGDVWSAEYLVIDADSAPTAPTLVQ